VTKYRDNYIADSRAITEEIKRHHIVLKRRVPGGDTWEITCSCGATTGEGNYDSVLVVWDDHFQQALRSQ